MFYFISVCFTLILIPNILKVQYTKERWPRIILVLIITIFITAIYTLLTILLIFWIYRSIVRVIAKLKYGSNFLGFVEGTDVIYASNNISKNLTTALLILEDKFDREDIFEVVKEIINEKILQNAKLLPKFQSSFINFMGYRCIIKNAVNLEDCVKKLAETEYEELDEKQLLNLISECYTVPLPKNETVLWDVFVGGQRLRWTRNKKDAKHFPVFVRVHNGILNGTSLLKIFTEILSDGDVIETLSSSEHPIEIKQLSKTQIFIKNILSFALSSVDDFYTLVLAPAVLLEGFKYKGEELNFIYTPTLSGKEVLAFQVKETGDYVEKIKWIKRKVPETTFSDVVITAFSGSLKDYFQEHSPLYPEYLTSAVQVVADSTNLKPSIIFINLPLFFEKDEKDDESLINRLNLIKSQTDFSNKSMEMQINHFLKGPTCSVIPSSIVHNVYGDLQCSSTLCFVPGPQKLTFNQGKLVVSECVFWLPQQNNCGVNLSLFTYDNVLHVGINSDQTHIRSSDAAQDILDGIFTNLDRLEKELKLA